MTPATIQDNTPMLDLAWWAHFRWRRISHSYFKGYLDRVIGYQQTAAYQKAMRKRQVWVEPKFAESKMWHQGQRCRLRRIHNVNIEALLRASVQNLKQLLRRHLRRRNPLKPADAQALAIPVPLFLLLHGHFRLFGSVFFTSSPGSAPTTSPSTTLPCTVRDFFNTLE